MSMYLYVDFWLVGDKLSTMDWTENWRAYRQTNRRTDRLTDRLTDKALYHIQWSIYLICVLRSIQEFLTLTTRGQHIEGETEHCPGGPTTISRLLTGTPRYFLEGIQHVSYRCMTSTMSIYKRLRYMWYPGLAKVLEIMFIKMLSKVSTWS